MTKYDDFYDVKFFTDKDLVKHPTIRIRHLEYMLSYFFGETKLSVTGDNCSLELVNLDLPNSDFFRTYFSASEIQEITLSEYYDRFWKLVYRAESRIGEYKKSR